MINIKQECESDNCHNCHYENKCNVLFFLFLTPFLLTAFVSCYLAMSFMSFTLSVRLCFTVLMFISCVFIPMGYGLSNE